MPFLFYLVTEKSLAQHAVKKRVICALAYIPKPGTLLLAADSLRFVLSWLFCDQSKERVDLSRISHSPASTKERDQHKAGLSAPEELVTQVNQQVRGKKAAEAMGSCLRPGRDTAMEADDTKTCSHAKRIFLAPLGSRGICVSLWVFQTPLGHYCHVPFSCIQEGAWRQGRTRDVSRFVQPLTGH